MLDAIGAGLAPRIGDRDWADIWRDSPEYQVMRNEIEAIKERGMALPAPDKNDESSCKWSYKCAYHTLLMIRVDATSFWVQLKEVVRRNNMALWRSPDYVFSRLFIHAFISLQISLCFLQLGISLRDLQYRVFAM
jgi:ATP-binding cassette, subfamily G (WHITE), member 2, SNQ2